MRQIIEAAPRQPEPMAFTIDDARRSIDRLKTFTEILFDIDSGNYPLRDYSSGEHKMVRGKDGVLVETDEYVSMTIWRDPNSRELGLRNNLTHAIFSEFLLLGEMGAGQIADNIVHRRIVKNE
jgi:hypothetical protein